jgi:hypothetical protein
MEENVKDAMDKLKYIKREMDLPDRWEPEDARIVFREICYKETTKYINEKKDERTDKILKGKKLKRKTNNDKNKDEIDKEKKNNKKPKKKIEYKHKYKFSQKPGHATNKQLSLIQELREQLEKDLLDIRTDEENVPRISFDEADKMIKTLMKESGWEKEK